MILCFLMNKVNINRPLITDFSLFGLIIMVSCLIFLSMWCLLCQSSFTLILFWALDFFSLYSTLPVYLEWLWFLPNMMKYCYGLWVLLGGRVVSIDTIYRHITFSCGYIWSHVTILGWFCATSYITYFFEEWFLCCMIFFIRLNLSATFSMPFKVLGHELQFSQVLILLLCYWPLQFYALWNSTYNTSREGSPNIQQITSLKY